MTSPGGDDRWVRNRRKGMMAKLTVFGFGPRFMPQRSAVAGAAAGAASGFVYDQSQKAR
jgi:hypothetical protein